MPVSSTVSPGVPASARLSLRLPVPEAGALYLPADVPPLTEDELFELCRQNSDLRIERTAEGGLIVMPPSGGYSGYRGSRVTHLLRAWAERDGSGEVFDSSTGFRLPGSRALRSPDAAWVRRERLASLTRSEKQCFLPLCPDFLMEIASPSDRPADLQQKMREYRAAGLALGWLIQPADHPEERRVEVWTQEQITVLSAPTTLSADPLLPGFTLDLASIWDPPF